VTAGPRVTIAKADFVLSALEVAMTWMVRFAGGVAGAVKLPFESIAPQALLAHPEPETLHVTPAPARLPVRAAENGCVLPAPTRAVSGITPIWPEDDLVVRHPGRKTIAPSKIASKTLFITPPGSDLMESYNASKGSCQATGIWRQE
jgi:hypothetical protein